MKTFKEYLLEGAIYINLPSSHQQTNYSCGSVSLRSIAKYYGKDLEDEKHFRDLCDSGERKGTHPDDIVRAARSLGFDAELHEHMSLKELISYISHKIPVIVNIQAWSNEKNPLKKAKAYNKLEDGHYVVAIGFNDANIYFEDPSEKDSRMFIPKTEMIRRWKDKEAYDQHSETFGLGIVIRSHTPPKEKQVINKVKKLP